VGELATTATEPNTLAMCPLNAYNPWAMSLYLKKKATSQSKKVSNVLARERNFPVESGVTEYQTPEIGY
jgi:hypothetical protein